MADGMEIRRAHEPDALAVERHGEVEIPVPRSVRGDLAGQQAVRDLPGWRIP
jgi:hypothetical protein